MATSQTEGSTQPRIVRGVVDSLSLYEITDYELEVLERGSPNSVFLNFAIFFLSIAASFSAALATFKIDSMQVYVAFMVVAVVGWAAGLVLLVLWYRNRSQLTLVIKKIKARVEVRSAQAQISNTTGPAIESSPH
jgi:hypothetical protein